MKLNSKSFMIWLSKSRAPNYSWSDSSPWLPCCALRAVDGVSLEGRMRQGHSGIPLAFISLSQLSGLSGKWCRRSPRRKGLDRMAKIQKRAKQRVRPKPRPSVSQPRKISRTHGDSLQSLILSCACHTVIFVGSSKTKQKTSKKQSHPWIPVLICFDLIHVAIKQYFRAPCSRNMMAMFCPVLFSSKQAITIFGELLSVWVGRKRDTAAERCAVLNLDLENFSCACSKWVP